jgi:hypothetical protein
VAGRHPLPARRSWLGRLPGTPAKAELPVLRALAWALTRNAGAVILAAVVAGLALYLTATDHK